MIAWLGARSPFPPLDAALAEPNGLLAVGGDLSCERLLAAYRAGVFPWYSEGQPILWWSPNPRMVLYVDEFRVSRSLAKRVHSGRFELRIDTDFRAVIEACAATSRAGQGGTWIMPQMVEAYCELHRLGYAHSVESFRDGRLVGGLYGLALGRMFFGESMFAAETDASKVALVQLVAHLQHLGVSMIDCQQETAHLAGFGARPIPRDRFAAHLAQLINSTDPPAVWSSGRPEADTGARTGTP
ncbi:MAG: leucyl/phenylalanyl-tRNA--protein transferase [Burkholderiales bacterium]|nr:leucyl/phenylalanyl-tRNA--protein transferase [Burkholderiales bacterium]